jgi:hypothetical protein
MAWFHKGPLRNTTGQSVSGAFFAAGQHNSTAPRPGGWRAHSGINAEALNARPHQSDQGQHVEAVKRHVAHCQGMAVRQQPLTPKTTGRCASFFKAAVRDLGGCLGLGMGRINQAQPAWSRPDREATNTKPGRPNPTHPPNLTSRTSSLRQADQAVARLERVDQQLRGTKELLQTTASTSTQQSQHAMRNWLDRDREHQAAKAHLTQVQRQYDQAKQAYQLDGQEGWRLTTTFRQQRASNQSSASSMQPGALDAPSPSIPLQTDSSALNSLARAERALQACTALHQNSSNALKKAQTRFEQVQRHGSSSTAARALNETLQELSARCDKHKSMLDRAQAVVNHRKRTHSSTDTSNGANQATEDLRGQLTSWLVQRNHRRTALGNARQTLLQARQAERDAHTQLQGALVQLQTVSPTAQDMVAEAATLDSLEQRVQESLTQARATQAQRTQELADAENARSDQLLQHPPGFQADTSLAELCGELRSLRDRLSIDGVNTSASNWPVNDTLEVVCGALALESNGNASVAANILRELTQRSCADLVPRPGQWFDGSPRIHGEPVPPTSPLEAFISRLNDLPCGTELLVRLVSTPDNRPPANQRDAVSVYHQAMRAVAAPQTTDTASWMWLQCAAFAACHIAHPQTPPVVLSAQQRAAFHGVRNGLTSVAPGSSYDQANKQLLRLSDEWTRSLHGNNPFKTRQTAAAVATQVGLPTPIRQSNEALLASCSRLQDAITAQVVQFRREAQQQGQRPDFATMEPLLEAACLLKHIQKRADRHLRLDQMPIERQAWRSVDKHTKRWMKKEDRIAPTPASLRAEVQRLGLRTPQPDRNLGISSSVDMTGLQTCLLELRCGPSNALAAVEALHAQLGTMLSSAQAPALATGPLPPIAEESEDELADDERQDLISQTAQDVGWSDAQKSLQTSKSLQTEINAFTGKKSDWDSKVLPNWITPVVGVNSSAVTMNHGHSVGLSTSALTGTVSRVLGVTGVSIRLDADVSTTKQQQVRWARQSRGMEFFAGDQQQCQGRFGLAGGLGYAFFTLPTEDTFSLGGVASWSIGRSRTDTHGVLLRSPNDGQRSTSQVKEEFSAMVDTMLGWRELRDDVSDESYSSPLQAILARHEQVSVGTVEQLRTVANITRSGLAASVSGGGPFSVEALPGLSGTAGISAGLLSERRSETTQYKTAGGIQGFEGNTANTTKTVSAQFAYSGQIGGNVKPVGEGQASLRGRNSSAILQLDLQRKQALSSTTVIRQPNGNLVGEKAREFNTFEAFRLAVQPRWDEWIERAIQARQWPQEIPVHDQRLLAAQALEDFMSAAESSVRQGGTVTLNETLEVRPEVCSELSANLALEELAVAKGDRTLAHSLFERRQQLLAADESYQPYKLKAIVRSQVDSGVGIDLVLSLLRKQGASATHEYDSYPK